MAILDMQYLDSITPSIPVVLLNRYLKQYHTAGIDNQKLGADIASLIASRGHKSVSVFCTHSPFLAVGDRVAGFIDGCRQLKIEIPNHAILFTEDSIDGGVRAAAEYVRLPQKPNVIFCDSDSIALGVLYELNRSGVRVPTDVSILCIGLYHSSVTRYSIPPLTVSEVPLRKMAETCMDHLTEIIHQEAAEPAHFFLETSITIRESFL